jgi:hypothetical protein
MVRFQLRPAECAMNVVYFAATIIVSIRVDIGWRAESAPDQTKKAARCHREAFLEL